MARTSFFNDNENRAYPFVNGTVQWLPQPTVVDFGCLMGINSGYVEGQHRVWLAGIYREDFMFHFVFRSDAPGLAGYELTFSFAVRASVQYMAQYAACGVSVSPESLSECVDDSLWSGFMVIGNLFPLARQLDDEQSHDEAAIIEPALIRSLVQGYARTLNLANQDRTRATAAEGCNPLCWSYLTGGVIERDTCLIGDIRFVAGYNCKIDEDASENTITISALAPADPDNVNGPPCVEVPLFPGESPPEGRTRLDGALACNEVFRSINGIGGRTVSILSGNGVNITNDVDHHTIIIDVNLHNMAVCEVLGANPPAQPDDEHCDSISVPYDPCRCGPAQ